MNKVVSINLNGFIFTIDEMAYEKLRQYIGSLRRHFEGTEGGAEIISDIETRIAELLQARISTEHPVVLMEDVDHVMALMGDPLEMDEKEGQEQQGNTGYSHEAYRSPKLRRDTRHKILGGVCTGIANYLGIDPFLARGIFLVLLFVFGSGVLLYIILWIAIPKATPGELPDTTMNNKRLFRNPDDKMLGGVCGGVSAYFGTEAMWLRIAFMVAVFFYGTGVLLYIVLWIILPKAKTATEKLQMAGEPVDVSAIEKRVRDTFAKGSEGFRSSTGKIAASSDRARGLAGELVGFVGRLIMKVIGFAVTVTGIALLALAVVVGVGVGSTQSVMGLVRITAGSSFVYNMLMLGMALFLLSIIVAFLVSGVKLLFNLHYKARFANVFAAAVSIVSVMMLVAGGVRYASSVDHHESVTEELLGNVPAPHTLYLHATERFPKYSYYDKDPQLIHSDEGYFIHYLGGNGYLFANTELYIKPSNNDSMSFAVIKKAYGGSDEEAHMNAKRVDYRALYADSALTIDHALLVPAGGHFVYQAVSARLLVPVGTVIRVDRHIMSMMLRSEQLDNEDWDFGETFVMTRDGLKCQDCSTRDWNDEDDDDDDRWDSRRHRRHHRFDINIDDDDEDADGKDKGMHITIGEESTHANKETSTNPDGSTTTKKVHRAGPVTITETETEKQ